MNLKEYKKKRALYSRFAEVVKDILEAAIAADPGYHLQQIQTRAKTPESLEKRLTESDQVEASNIEELRNDLAGSRVIFYYNDDVTRFLSSGVIPNNFKILSSKVFHPGDATDANSLYTANHFVVQLDDNRAALPEYAPYAGLKCEIQIQTTLNHAWSATTHDIIYKRAVDGFGSNIMESIESRLAKVMQEYLKPAGYEFQKIQRDHARLLEGKAIYDLNIKDEIVRSANNNERYEVFQRFEANALPLYDREYLEAELDSIYDIIESAIEAAQGVPPQKIETPYGEIEGKTASDILEIAIKAIEYLWPLDASRAFATITTLYLRTSNIKDKERLEKAAASLAGYNLNALQQVGYFVQDVILDHLEKLSPEELDNARRIAINVASQILEPSAESTTSAYRTFTINQAALSGDENLAKVRARAIKLLVSLYKNEYSEEEKKSIISALNNAAKTPHLQYSDKLLSLIYDNTTEVINFFMTLISSGDYEVLESVEEDVSWHYKRANISAENHSAEAFESAQNLRKIATNFRDQLNKDSSYVIYKTLVGYESVFPESWDNEDWGYEKEKPYREQKAIEYVASIKENTQDFWTSMILRCAQTESIDMATFPYFGFFLTELAKTKPDFALGLVDLKNPKLEKFFSSILDGLFKHDREKAIALIRRWLAETKYLGPSIYVFMWNDLPDLSLLEELLQKAIEQENLKALSSLIAVVVRNFKVERKELIQAIILPAIKTFTAHKNPHWIHDVWFMPEMDAAMQLLDANGADIILKNLLLLSKIDFYSERILEKIAKQFPEKVLEFFGSRLVIEREEEHEERYEPIPYNLLDLQKVLGDHPELVLKATLSWDVGDGLFQYRGGRFIKAIFPTVTPELELALANVVNVGNEKEIRAVMAVLSNYKGETPIQNIARSAVKVLPEGSKILNQIWAALLATGVVHGEWGFVEAYKNKYAELESWLEDTDPKVQAFGRKLLDSLQQQINAEIRRTEESVALGKLDYPEEPESSQTDESELANNPDESHS